MADEFPPNTFKDRPGAPEPEPEKERPEVKQVTTEPVTVRKPSRSKKFSGLFFSGDAKTAGSYAIYEVLIPAAKDMIVEAGSSLIERIIFGDSRRRRGSTPPVAGPTGFVSYNRYAMGQSVPTQQTAPAHMSPRGRANHDFDEIVFSSRIEAQLVLEQLFEVASRFGWVSVSDLYASVGQKGTHVDAQWGWRTLQGVTISKVRGGGYVLDLVPPVHV